jgi:hypothetical protein
MNPETRRTLVEASLALSKDQTARLMVDEWRYHPEQNFISVRYRVQNESKRGSLAAFDREVYVPYPSYVYAPGKIGAPFAKINGADIELIHAAYAGDTPPSGTPLAIEVTKGEQIEGYFSFSIGDAKPERLRWCVGVMAFEKDYFDRPFGSGNGRIWFAKADVKSLQTMLCTPWYDVAQARFEAVF